MQLLADIQRTWKDGGLKIVLARTFKKMTRPAFKAGSLVFIECDLRNLCNERRVVSGIILREATVNDAHLFEDRELFFERLREGHRCFMGIEEATGKLTNYRWVSTSTAWIPELNRYLVLRPDEAYVYDLNTLPEFRRRGIDAYTRHAIYTYLRDSGYTKVYAYIHGDNLPSIKASRILLQPMGRVWYLQLRGCEPIIIGGKAKSFVESRSQVPDVQLAKSA